MAPARLPPIITLTTDFGLMDHYAGTMKGVVLKICPDARIVDISHDIAPFSIAAGAYEIAQAAPYFPDGTIHVVVIDPGVGTSRKALLVAASGQYFVAPDNGVLSMIVAQDRTAEAREITNRDLWLKPHSSTFHGRDIFAPVAAALASGTANPEEVGPVLVKIELIPDLEPKEIAPGVWRGRLLSADRFGNAITNFKADAFPAIASGGFRMRFGDHEIDQFHPTFGDAPPGVPFAYFGSSGYLEAGVIEQSAAELLHARAGDSITLYVQSTL
jgi:S-adenosylmethionine hydrolase